MMVKIGDMTINPTKIICLGRNYIDHIKEMNSPVPKEPVFFGKTVNTLLTDNNPIIYPKILYDDEKRRRLDHEVELAFVISKRCKMVKPEHAYDYILGYSVYLDMTARTMQINDRNIKLPWYRAKNFDTFGPIGPRIIPREDISDPHTLEIRLKVNGEIRQSSNTKHLLFRIPKILEYISQFVTLEAGDIVATGTPGGVGAVLPGDMIEASIEKIGKISHKIVLESSNC
jgi:2-keto-4-pentenoate hydratase/2-oxohepta-3-ene-1,7-dioic acid hydratase in catechol pathway